MDYTTVRILDRIKKRSMVPVSQNTYENDDILGIATEELYDSIVPMIMSTNGEFFVHSEDILVSSNTEFDIPQRALGSKLRDIQYITSDDDEYSVPYIEPEDTERFNSPITPRRGWYFQDDKIKILGQWNQTDYIRIKTYRRPGELVQTSECALISSVAGNVATCSNVPSDWTTSDEFDVIQGNPHFRSRGDDNAITDVTTGDDGTVTFSSIPTGTQAGDYICIAGESCIPQIPYVAFSLLQMKTAYIILSDMGRHKGAERILKNIDRKEERIIGLLSKRVKGENRKIVNQYNFAWSWRGGY